MKIIIAVQVFLSLVIIGLLTYPMISSPRTLTTDAEELREFAAGLQAKELYPQAIAAYRDYLNKASLPPDKRAGILFTIGEIYRENLHDYAAAMAEYMHVKQLVPEGDLSRQASRNIVQTLERMKRSADAQRELDKTARAGAEKEQTADPNQVVAKIGDRQITLAEVKNYYDRLPESVRNKFKDKEGLVQFVREYAVQDLLYSAAQRAGYDKDSKVAEGIQQAEKALMIEKLYQEEVQKTVSVEPGDLKLYYDGHPELFKKKVKNPAIGAEEEVRKSFEEAAPEVERAARGDKEQAKYSELISRMVSAEKVEFNEDKIPNHF